MSETMKGETIKNANIKDDEDFVFYIVCDCMALFEWFSTDKCFLF